MATGRQEKEESVSFEFRIFLPPPSSISPSSVSNSLGSARGIELKRLEGGGGSGRHVAEAERTKERREEDELGSTTTSLCLHLYKERRMQLTWLEL